MMWVWRSLRLRLAATTQTFRSSRPQVMVTLRTSPPHSASTRMPRNIRSRKTRSILLVASKSNPNPQAKSVLKCRDRSFVQNAAASRSDDPFSSAYKPPQRRMRLSYSTEDTPTSSRLNSRTQGMWRAGGNSSQNSESPICSAQEPSTEGRAKISGHNAQSHYSPSACIFVAKQVFPDHSYVSPTNNLTACRRPRPRPNSRLQSQRCSAVMVRFL